MYVADPIVEKAHHIANIWICSDIPKGKRRTPGEKATGPLPKDIGSGPVKRYSAKRRIT